GGSAFGTLKTTVGVTALHKYEISASPDDIKNWRQGSQVDVKLKVYRDGHLVRSGYKITAVPLGGGLDTSPENPETDGNGEAGIHITGTESGVPGVIFKLKVSIDPDDASKDSKLSAEIWLRAPEAVAPPVAHVTAVHADLTSAFPSQAVTITADVVGDDNKPLPPGQEVKVMFIYRGLGVSLSSGGVDTDNSQAKVKLTGNDGGFATVTATVDGDTASVDSPAVNFCSSMTGGKCR
ncbi:hypothetical protein ACWKX9_26280, partial [Enterobacter asburiae]